MPNFTHEELDELRDILEREQGRTFNFDEVERAARRLIGFLLLLDQPLPPLPFRKRAVLIQELLRQPDTLADIRKLKRGPRRGRR